MTMNKRKILPAIAAASIVSIAPGASAIEGSDQEFAIERQYCTQFGPFFLRFDPDKAAGVFAILTNNDLGSVVGAVDGRQFVGVWTEVDSHGEIRIAFSDDWSRFDAEYALHSSPEQWRGGWVGRLAPEGRPARFEADGQTFYCR